MSLLVHVPLYGRPLVLVAAKVSVEREGEVSQFQFPCVSSLVILGVASAALTWRLWLIWRCR